MEKKFDFNTIKDFDKHINLSIPDYGHLLDHISSLSTFFIKENSNYYDIGCSTGNLINKIKEKNKHIDFNAVGIDKSSNLAKKHTSIIIADAVDFAYEKFNFATIVFTLQFLEIDQRECILEKMYKSMTDNGALIVCEKQYEENGFFQNLFDFTYYDYKKKNFSDEEILKKQFDLRYIMNPSPQRDNLRIFHKAGFYIVQPFWQSLLFKGWILMKGNY